MVSEILKFSEILSLWELLIPEAWPVWIPGAYRYMGPLNIGPHGLDWQDFNTVQHSTPLSLQPGHINPAL